MTLHAKMIIGQADVGGAAGDLFAHDAFTGEQLAPAFGAADEAQVALACESAARAFDEFRETPQDRRAEFLEAIAEAILSLGDDLIRRAHSETALPAARLEGERMRTVGQLRFFAAILRKGHWQRAVLDAALPDRKPLPRSDLRQRRIALGPVVVFGASNFPLAFSVAGGDTASALAAGCPVVVKAHSAHLGTSALVGQAVRQAARQTRMPDGVFSLVFGDGHRVGQALVGHPAIKAVGFTGSRRGGVALMGVAQGRPEPIPVFAEMSSTNPSFLLPAALGARSGSIAVGFVDSLVLGAGQFCTNPGLAVGLEGEDLDAFCRAAAAALARKPAANMLTPGIHSSYCEGVSRLAGASQVSRVGDGLPDRARYEARAALFLTSAERFLAEPLLQEEVFGPASLVVACRNADEMQALAEALPGQLTATLHLDEADHPLARRLVPVLERKAGRILCNDYPTGVEVAHAMVHGGPFPATSDSRTTSVGAAAMERFLRPVCYQNVPEALLPAPLRTDNPMAIPRWRDGTLDA